MPHVQTVLGPIDPTDLGFTLPHEHTQIALWHIQSRWDYWQLTRDEPVILEELARFRAAGGRSLVDLTLPMALTRESTNDNSTVQAVKVGPIVLGGLFGSSNLSALPVLDPATLTATSTPLQYTAAGVTLQPFYKVHGQRYTVYWSVTGGGPTLPAFVAYYPFDNSAADTSGNGKTATLNNAAYTTGRVGWLATKDGDGVGVGSPTTRSAPVPGFRAATVRPTPAPPRRRLKSICGRKVSQTPSAPGRWANAPKSSPTAAATPTPRRCWARPAGSTATSSRRARSTTAWATAPGS